jgi:2-dehydro-3-deoxyglucarate aldolase/4-hydroxy-2-oxoheptanedioate aldolase
MILSPTQTLKQKLKNGETALGLWVTLESPSITEMALLLGLDWVCIDSEHGHLDFKEVLEHIRAANRSEVAVIVRVQEIEQGVIKRVLDLGADGIIVPQICTAEEVERAVYFAKYPPRGFRGVGGERATLWGRDLPRTRSANENTLVIPLVETVAAGKNIESIMQVPGVDAFFFGPADFSASSGYLGEWEGPGVAEEILRIQSQIRARGFACGVMATDAANGQKRIAQGFQMVGIGADASLLIRGMADMMQALGRSVRPQV